MGWASGRQSPRSSAPIPSPGLMCLITWFSQLPSLRETGDKLPGHRGKGQSDAVFGCPLAVIQAGQWLPYQSTDSHFIVSLPSDLRPPLQTAPGSLSCRSASIPPWSTLPKEAFVLALQMDTDIFSDLWPCPGSLAQDTPMLDSR